ncbi:PAS domain-containing protein [Halorubrum aquaticum]|uniref:histidine kinase n=1 Tax=Halorubrum aquaticum TaxID=387340 RepID=A0A1I3BL27_9EURY|nr:histidine kinase N-terminal 7TM domain-containing protein [Halorubrum aquaticum]SFH62880.1 PAS domain-containing protein [Halorubrum aquaticum]
MSDPSALPVQAYLLACLLSGAVGLLLGRVAWTERDEPGGLEVSLYLVCAGAIAILYAVRVASADPLVMVGALQTATPFLAAMPVLWIAFAFAYAGRDEWRTERRLVALATPGFLWVLLAWSSRTHGLARLSFDPVVEGPFTLLEGGIGPAGIAFLLYAYGLYVAGLLVIVDLYRRTGNRYRLQTFVALLGTLFPLLAGVATVVDFGSYSAVDWTPAAFVVHGVFLYGVVFWLGTLDAAVVARDTAVEVMQDPVIVAGSDGRIRDLNPAAERILPDDAVGESLSTAFPGLESGDEHPVTIDGRQFDIQEDPITDPRGTDRGHVFLLRDVTARERRRAALQRRERQLERQNERLEDFAGVVSHDLRNPLAAATAAVELARHGDGDDDALDRAADAHERMDELIEGLLSLATAGRAVDAVEPVSIEAAVRTVWSRLETGSATLVIEDADETVLADGDRLQQLVANLFRNSVEHGSTSSRPAADDSVEHAGSDVTVTVESERTDGEVTLRIADDGPGIPEEERARVFERGVSLDDGTGLGLAIVGDVAEAHGWSVRAVDGPDGGACFEIDGIEVVAE